MNCEEFNKAVLSEPNADSMARREHAAACPDCARLFVRVRRMERELSVVLAVPVPESLSGDVPDVETLARREQAGDDGNVVAFPAGRSDRGGRGRWPAIATLAAALALVAVFVLRPPAVEPVDGAALAAEVFEHVDHELGAMRPATTAVTDETLGDALRPAGVRMASDSVPGLVSYARSCVIDGKLVPHLVVQGAAGPVTVLIMPDQRVDGPMSIARDGLEGVILPVGDGGSIAIVGRDAASVDAVRDIAGANVDFTAT